MKTIFEAWTHWIRRATTWGMACALLTGPSQGAPLGTEFSYQGYLTESGVPASGAYDLQFRLFDAAAGGAQVGPTVARDDVPLQAGLFNVALDFGSVFAGQSLWLEVSMRPGETAGAFTLLGNRQAILPAPYALYAAGGGVGGSNADTFVRSGANAIFSAGNVGIGTLSPSAPLEVTGNWDRGGGSTVPNLSLSGSNPTLQWAGNPMSDPSFPGLGPRISWILHQGAEGPGSLQFFSRERSALAIGGSDTGWRRVLTLMPTGQLRADGNGIALNPVLGPVVTRGFAPFQVSSKSAYHGHGRWGYFVESQAVVAGLPDPATAGEGAFQVRRYYEDGNSEVLFSVSNRNGTEVKSQYLNVEGLAGENAYLGGDGLGGDVEVGSRNPAIPTVVLWNSGRGETMNLVGSDAYLRDANVRALVIRGGADLAEPFAISHAPTGAEPGSIVIIDEANPGKLRLSHRRQDTRVAGIVSGANGIHPGISMIQEDALEPGVNVALSGRVYAKADSSGGPIRPGDLLTTSDRPGYAMRVADAQAARGAVLGKAMTPLTTETGLVLVLVTLQ